MSTITMSIPKFNELIEPFLNGGKVLSHTTRAFTQPGDNYGSEMLGIAVKVQKKNGKIEYLDVVSKLLPKNEMFLKIFQPERLFQTESFCYTVVAPAFRKLVKEKNVPDGEITDVFAKCYGTRMSLNECSERVDSDAVILLENLNTLGYKMGDRFTGFDYQHALIVLRDLASFHALGIAMRILKPKEFDEEFRPYLKPFAPETEEMRIAMTEDILNDIKNMPDVNDEVFGKIFALIEQYTERRSKKVERPDTIYTTLSHNDLWMNNMMIHYDSNGKPDKTKIIDFQITDYDSLVYDVTFFLMLNVETVVLQTKFDELLQVYHHQFRKCLGLLGCPIEEYTFKKFQDEISQQGPIQLIHILMLVKVMYGKKIAVEHKLDMDKIFNEESFDNVYKIKMNDVINIFQKRNWL